MLIGASRKRFIGSFLGELGCSELRKGRVFGAGCLLLFFSTMCSNPREVLEQLGFYQMFFFKLELTSLQLWGLRKRGIGICFSATFWGRETQVYSWFSL